jgi:hypothetical protein
MNSEKPTLYVTKAVKNPRVFEAVKSRVEDSGTSTVVVGSTKGKSAIQLSDALGGKASVVSVTEFTYSDDVKKAMKKKKIAAVEKADLPIQDNREMRETLMMFGPGVKATLEVAAIAVSKGLAQGNFIAVAGGDKNLETAILVSSDHPEKELISDPLKQLLVKEVIALKGY